MSLVLDSSATLAWAYLDETTDPIVQLFAGIEKTGAWVPMLWHLEVANSLELSVRRRRHDRSRRNVILANLALLPILIDGETHKRAWTTTLELAETHRLTLYDATYLELAIRRSLPLATLDKDLRRAAETEGLQLCL